MAVLVGAMRSEGLDARRADWEQKSTITALKDRAVDLFLAATVRYSTFGIAEFVILWIAARAGEAVVNQAVQIAVEWLRERHRQEPEGRARTKSVRIVRYEEDRVVEIEIVELESADSEPTRRPPMGFEGVTPTKPPGR